MVLHGQSLQYIPIVSMRQQYQTSKPKRCPLCFHRYNRKNTFHYALRWYAEIRHSMKRSRASCSYICDQGYRRSLGKAHGTDEQEVEEEFNIQVIETVYEVLFT